MITTSSAHPLKYTLPADSLRARITDLSPRLQAVVNDAATNHGGVAFHGPIGAGKTYAMLAAFAQERHKILGLWVDWPEFCVDRRRYYDLTGEDKQRFDPLEYLRSFPGPLFIDDVGAERDASGHNLDLFDQIIDARYKRGARLYLTTNRSLVEIGQRYGERCASRLAFMCHWYEMSGADRRVAS